MLSFDSPMAVFVALTTVCAAIFIMGSARMMAGLFRYIPPVLLVVFLPATFSAYGVLPRSSLTYDLLRDYALPFGLLLMIAMTDVRSVLRVGPKALLLTVAGSLGVCLGGGLAFLLFYPVLPDQAWKMFAAIAASWIGGGANFAAVQTSVDMPPALLGPAIVVDATINYLWLAVLLTAVSYQHVVRRFYEPDPRFTAGDQSQRNDATESATAFAPNYQDLLTVVGIALPAAALAMYLGQHAYILMGGDDNALSSMFGAYAMGIICVTLTGVALSFTPARKFDVRGGTSLAYAAQFLFFASLGAQADFSAILAMPVLVLAGILWILVHGVVLLLAARLIKAPMALIAVASIANIGGSSTAALIGAQYGREWASLGVLLGLLGSLSGTFIGLLFGYLISGLAG